METIALRNPKLTSKINTIITPMVMMMVSVLDVFQRNFSICLTLCNSDDNGGGDDDGGDDDDDVIVQQ